MLLGEFFHAQLKKAGINTEDDAIKNFLMHGEFLKIDVPDDIVTSLDSKLISITDAKNNHPDIKPHYTKQSLLTVDKTIEKMLEELGFEDADKAEILSEGSTYKRVPALIHKVRELEARKSLSGKDDKVAIQKQIDELHANLRAEKERADKSEVEFKNRLRQYKIENKTQSLYNGYKTIYDELDPEIRAMNIQNLLNKNLQDSNSEITFDDNENLVLRKKDGTNFYGDNNQQVNPQQYLDLLLSKNKLLVTSQKPPAAPANNPQTNALPQPPNGSAGANNNAYLKSLIALSQKDMEGSKTPIM